MNSRWMRAALLTLTLLVPLAAAAAKPVAPVPTGTGTLKGTVTIVGTRTIVAGAVVTAVGGGSTYSVTTGTKGTYTFTLPAGTYYVSCKAAGYNAAYAGATVRVGAITILNFAVLKSIPTTGTVAGRVTDPAGAAIAGAVVSTEAGGYLATTDAAGAYTLSNVLAGPYTLTAGAVGFAPVSRAVTVEVGATAAASFSLPPAGTAITAIAASPASFAEGSATTVALSATLSTTATAFTWRQLAGPRVPLAAASAASATADVSTLSVAAETELAFELEVTDAAGAVSRKQVQVAVSPVDMFPLLGANVQLGGATTAIARRELGGVEYAFFNVGSALYATPVGMVPGPVYGVVLPGQVFDVEFVVESTRTLALVACANAGIAVVDVSVPTAMLTLSVTPVNYYQGGIVFTDTGGTTTYDNVIQSTTAPIVGLETDGVDLFIADFAFGLHRTALANLVGLAGPVLEADGTLLVDAEVYTLQYAGENPWGGPLGLELWGGRIFAPLGALGLGIFDPVTLQQVGRYSLYTDVARTEDFFGAMDINLAVAKDAVTGDLFLDDYTGMPDYRQVWYEVTQVMKGTATGLSPWADFERLGKWYYKAQDVSVLQQGARTLAYVAYSLGGVVAVDVTGFAAATAANFLKAPYVGYFPAVPVNGPYETNSLPSSLLPYEGAGMLKESGVTSVRATAEYVYLTDHFAGLVILSGAATPDLSWHGPTPPYANDTDGIANDDVPDYEDITSYDMSPWNPLDNESLPWAFYQPPALLATKELHGHGYTLELREPTELFAAGDVDVLEASGAGGFVFVDVTNLAAANMIDRFAITAWFPTTSELGAAADGTATQSIALGHASGIEATGGYAYVSDGPHGVFAFNLTDAAGYPTDAIHLVANTLQNEYPQTVNGEIIYPASHTVRNVFDVRTMRTWAMCVSNGMRGVDVAAVEAGAGVAGAPLLLKLQRNDLYEHNAFDFVVKALPYQDKGYDVEFRGRYAFVADGAMGLTVYDTGKDPSLATNPFFIANVGYSVGEPLLGTASGIELWTDAGTDRTYAVFSAGPYGVGVVDVTHTADMPIVKVFEPIKIEDGDIAVADGQAIDVEVIGNRAYLAYDSFGVVAYDMADLIAPVPAGVNPTDLFKKALDGTLIYDYRPAAAGRFKLQYVPGYETVSGGAVRMDYAQQAGRLYLYVAFAEAGIVKIDFTDPAAPALAGIVDTAAGASDVAIANGRLHVADGSGGILFFK